MAGNPSSAKLHCSFCGKSQDEVRKLIAGPMVFICDECVGICMDIIGTEDASAQGQGQLSADEIAEAARQQQEAEAREKALSRTTPRLLKSLKQECSLLEHVRERLSGTIGALRERGVSDDEILHSLDITPEVAIDLYLGRAMAGARASSGRHGPAKAGDAQDAARPDAPGDEA